MNNKAIFFHNYDNTAKTKLYVIFHIKMYFIWEYSRSGRNFCGVNGCMEHFTIKNCYELERYTRFKRFNVQIMWADWTNFVGFFYIWSFIIRRSTLLLLKFSVHIMQAATSLQSLLASLNYYSDSYPPIYLVYFIKILQLKIYLNKLSYIPIN